MLTSAALESPDPKGCVEQDGDKASPSPSSLPTDVAVTHRRFRGIVC